MSTFGYEYICFNWIVSLKVYNMFWTLVSKIRIHARLSNTSYMRLHSWTSVYIVHTRTSANFPRYILSRHRYEGFVSNGSKNILHDNKIYSCTMELPNKSASLVVIFVLFCFHLRRVCDFIFQPKIPEKLLFIWQK